MRRTLLVSLALATTTSPAIAQTPRLRWEAPRWVGTFADEDRRVAQLTGQQPISSLLIRPLSRDSALATADSGRFTLAAFHPLLRSVYNSEAPYGMNDGAMWAGRGASLAAEVGIEARWRFITARIAPTFTWSQNQDFTLGALNFAPTNASPYADVFQSARIDRPQRFGEDAFHTVDAGQSMIRADWRALAVGASTENMWWGPGIDNSLLMSNTAAGIPHLFAGTGRPVDVRIGTLEAMYVLGRLYDSDYWRTGEQPNRNRRWLGGVVATFSPRGAPGLYLGAGRVFYEYIPPGGIGLRDVFDVLQPFTKRNFATPDNPDGDDSADQMLSLFGRWVFPSVGFEAYGEWGRNDHSWDWKDFILEPDHASARMFGFQKVFRNERRTLRVRGEIANLALGRTAQIRPNPPWYGHHIALQGYTQRGQVLGAGIGTGSDMQLLDAEWQQSSWRLGTWVERIRFDSDGFYRLYAPEGFVGRSGYHEVDVLAGLRFRHDWRWAAYSASLARTTLYNRYTQYLNNHKGVRAELRMELRP